MGQLNILPFLCESIATHQKARQEILKLYYENSHLFPVFDEQEFAESYFNDGTIEYDECIRVAFTMLSATEDVDLSNKIFDVIKKNWQYIYSFVENHETISLKKLIAGYMAKQKKSFDNMDSNEVNSLATICIFLASISGKTMIEDEFYKETITAWAERSEHKGYKPPIIKDWKVTEGITSYLKLINKQEQDPFRSILDTEGLFADTLLASIKLKDSDINKILHIMEIYYPEIKTHEQYQALLYFCLLIKAYKEQKKYYFNHSDLKYSKENYQLKQEIDNKDDEINNLKKEILSLKEKWDTSHTRRNK